MAEMQLGMPGAQKVGVHKGRMKRVREGDSEEERGWRSSGRSVELIKLTDCKGLGGGGHSGAAAEKVRKFSFFSPHVQIQTHVGLI